MKTELLQPKEEPLDTEMIDDNSSMLLGKLSRASIYVDAADLDDQFLNLIIPVKSEISEGQHKIDRKQENQELQEEQKLQVSGLEEERFSELRGTDSSLEKITDSDVNYFYVSYFYILFFIILFFKDPGF